MRIMRTLVASSFMVSYTINLLPKNFTVFVVFIELYLDTCNLQKYSLLLENSFILHLTLNVTSHQKDGCSLGQFLYNFKRFFIFNKGFFYAIHPNKPYFLKRHFTVLTKEGGLNFQTINSLDAVFF